MVVMVEVQANNCVFLFVATGRVLLPAPYFLKL
jgi:hypothetical protein